LTSTTKSGVFANRTNAVPRPALGEVRVPEASKPFRLAAGRLLHFWLSIKGYDESGEPVKH
jgi:hypothetical protein